MQNLLLTHIELANYIFELASVNRNTIYNLLLVNKTINALCAQIRDSRFLHLQTYDQCELLMINSAHKYIELYKKEITSMCSVFDRCYYFRYRDHIYIEIYNNGSTYEISVSETNVKFKDNSGGSMLTTEFDNKVNILSKNIQMYMIEHFKALKCADMVIDELVDVVVGL